MTKLADSSQSVSQISEKCQNNYSNYTRPSNSIMISHYHGRDPWAWYQEPGMTFDDICILFTLEPEAEPELKAELSLRLR